MFSKDKKISVCGGYIGNCRRCFGTLGRNQSFQLSSQFKSILQRIVYYQNFIVCGDFCVVAVVKRLALQKGQGF